MKTKYVEPKAYMSTEMKRAFNEATKKQAAEKTSAKSAGNTKKK